MNSHLIFSLAILIVTVHGQTINPQPIHHLKWVTHKTSFPIVLTKSHAESGSAYDWFKYDQYMYVTQLPNYKPDYYVSKQKFKSELTIFNYDTRTHESLTSYEPVRIDNNDWSTRELFDLAYLNSHRIRIDRDESNTAANITCIADFLVDKYSMTINPDLVKKMKDLALFKIDINEKSAGDFNEFRKRMVRKNWFQKHNLHAGERNHLQKIDQTQPRFKRDQPMETTSNKEIMNVRLSFGPITVVQPIKERLISCNLDLVNAESIGLDYHNKVYKYLTKNPIGLDLEAEDSIEKKQMIKEESVVADVVSSTPQSIETTTTMIEEDVNEMSDNELNKLFIAQEKVDHDFIEENVNHITETKEINAPVMDIAQSAHSSNKTAEKKETRVFNRRFFEIDDNTVIDDLSNMMFMLDKPKSKENVNSASQLAVNYTILIVIAIINAIIY